MRLATGKRIGQSRQELVPTVVFSFFLHILFFALALFLYSHVRPRAFVPPAYRVNLVALPADLAELAKQPDRPPVPPQEKIQERKAAPKPKAAAQKKGDMPELKPAKKPSKEPEVTAEEEPATERPSAPAADGGVAVTTPEDFKFAAYGSIIREKIRSRWHPQEGMRGLKASVAFRIHRSGRVIESHLQDGSGNFYFDQAAMRAILSASPFPPLPDEFPRQFVDFVVDLTPQDL